MSCLPLHAAIGIYPIVDSLYWIVRLAPLVNTLQLRIKNHSTAERNHIIAAAIRITQSYNTQLFINDYWQQAIEYGAYGVHVGQEDLDTTDIQALKKAGIRVGISTHNPEEIARAYNYQPSYLAFGPVFFTHSKPMKDAPIGVTQLAAWCKQAHEAKYQCVAIGGINHDNASAVAQAKPDGIATISAVTQSRDPVASIQNLATIHQRHV